MSSKRSTGAARKHTRHATRWGRYPLAGALLLAVLVACGISAQLFATSDTPHGSSLEDADPTLYAHGHRLRPLVEETGGAQTLNIYGPGGQIIAQAARDDQGSQAVRYLLADHLGSTRVVVGADGNAVAHFEYGPHGETAAAGTAAAEVRYRYTGHPYDESQGLYQTPARGYDPTLGRFLSVDPQRQDASPYVYAGNNPVGLVDPTGGGGVPFFIQSGFKVDANDRSPEADDIARRMGLRSDQHVLNAQSLFNRKDGSSAVDVIHQQGLEWLREGHNQRLYWMVGMETSAGELNNIRTGLDELRRWSPTLARDIVIINHEAYGLAPPTTPIEKQLTRIEEHFSVVHAAKAWGSETAPGEELFARTYKNYAGKQYFPPEDLRQYIDTSVTFMRPSELRRNIDSVAASVPELSNRTGVELHEFPSLLRAARINRPGDVPGISVRPAPMRTTRIVFVASPEEVIIDAPLRNPQNARITLPE